MSATEDTRRAAARVWSTREHAELEAAARFGSLARRLSEQHAVSAVVQLAEAAASDERRHAEQCHVLAQRFGATAQAAEPPREAPSVAPSALSARERVLYEVVAMSCVTETLSAVLLSELVERASDETVRSTMQAILRDEVRHSQLGWAHLAAEVQRGARDVVRDYLPAMLAGTVKDELFSAWPEHPQQAELSGLGALDRATRRRVFEQTLAQVIFPGLQRFGVDTTLAERWVSERTESASGEEPHR